MTLLPDYAVVTMTSDSDSTSEFTSAARVTVWRSMPDSQALTVYLSVGGNANSGEYSAWGGSYSASGSGASVTFEAGSSSATVTIQGSGEPNGVRVAGPHVAGLPGLATTSAATARPR